MVMSLLLTFHGKTEGKEPKLIHILQLAFSIKQLVSITMLKSLLKCNSLTIELSKQRFHQLHIGKMYFL